MGKCKHHPQSSTIPGDGVCPSCLQKKLKTVRWGETDCSALVAAEKPPPTTSGLSPKSSTVSKHKPYSIEPVLPKEAVAILGSIASIKKRNHRGSKPGRDITETALDFVLDSRYTDGVTSFRKPQQDSSPVEVINNKSGAVTPGLLCPPSKTISQSRGSSRDDAVKEGKGWSNAVSTLESTKSKPPTAKSSTASGGALIKSLALSDSKSGEPLVDRIAKETARRVIREVKDEMSVTEDEEPDVVTRGRATKSGQSDSPKTFNTYFSPSHWQSRIRSKWGIKGPSPITSSNKVFPSKSVENAQRMLHTHFHSPVRDHQSRANNVTSPARDYGNDRYNNKPSSVQQQQKQQPKVSSTQEMVIVGMPDRILKPEDMNQRLQTSHNTVLQWLEDLPFPDTLLFQQPIDADHDPCTMADHRSGSEAGGCPADLAIVGHLHEIAEEHELLDEDSSDEDASPPPTNHFNEVSSFGKFLIRAAQRQPREGLSRVQARVTAVTAR